MKNKIVETLFAFSYGGNNDFGEPISVGESIDIDFPTEAPTAYGFALRNKVDINLNEFCKISAKFETSEDINLIIEFKTLNSGGTAEKLQKYTIKRGMSHINFQIPDDLSSGLTEVCFVIFKKNNPNVKANFKIISIEAYNA